MIKNLILQELESYKYDFQYLKEKSNEIEVLKNELKKIYDRLNDIDNSFLDTQELQNQSKLILNKLTEEDDYIIEILDKKKKIEQRINNLEQPYKSIFYLKYIKFFTFDEIADKMCYSTKRIYQLHKEGIIQYLNFEKENNFEL